MTQKFCGYLSNHIKIEYKEAKPCKWSFTSFPHDKIAEKRAEFANVQDWESAGESCVGCKLREEQNLDSPRLQSLADPLFTQAGNNELVAMELEINRHCNSACLVCGPGRSTTWEKHINNAKYNIQNLVIIKKKDELDPDEQFIRGLLEYVDVSKVKEILISGGDPLTTESHLLFLSKLSDAQNITIRYTTNTTNWPDKSTFDLWSKFKKVYLQFGVYATGEHWNYLRWPLLWHQFERNFQKFAALRQTTNVDIDQFNYAITPFNLYYFDRCLDWASQYFDNPLDQFKFPPTQTAPGALTTHAIPTALQNLIRDKYGNDHKISQLLQPFDLNCYLKFIHYIQGVEKLRGLNWRQTFPEIANRQLWTQQ